MGGLRVDELVTRLRRRGVRMTAPRRAVLTVLTETGSHVTADEIHQRVLEHHPDVSASSVYRTMDLLADHGIVDHVHLGHGPAEYHLTDERHVHLVCDGCGVVVEVERELITPLVERIDDQLGFRVDLGHFALTGWCQACRTSAE